ncbi:MAG: XisI protein [Saprospiraceae bacterium]|nr:XisI protein [Saprospiraceae bacterium]
MDKITKYKTIVRKLVEEIGQLGSSSFEDVETQIITDDEHGHYLLYSNGWSNESRTYGCYVHIDVRPDGKVWLQHDGTNLVLANELLVKGILKTDLVLGFHSPFFRKQTEYAAA